MEDPKTNDISINLISVLHNVLDGIVNSLEDDEKKEDHLMIMVKLFQCLEMLYDSIDLTQNIKYGNEVIQLVFNIIIFLIYI